MYHTGKAVKGTEVFVAEVEDPWTDRAGSGGNGNLSSGDHRGPRRPGAGKNHIASPSQKTTLKMRTSVAVGPNAGAWPEPPEDSPWICPVGFDPLVKINRGMESPLDQRYGS